MSNIPSSAMPHAWAEDSEHAKEVRRARGEEEERAHPALIAAAVAGLVFVGLKLLFGRRRRA